ncbi:DUF4118 domain-containing protein [Phycicoccus jejuensis]|uniref:DUF4118 domain-containing protein n=1 Tax=Phycicoccus jejuensis TaxID=367299 RepID=UPI000689E933|nr:DUF4118 domain-containing protein [Phycicoccus jejuensis]
MSARSDLTLLHAASAFGPVLLAALLGLARDALTPIVVALVLVLAVVAVAAAGDRLSGVVAALSAALGYDVFFTRPFLSPTIASPADVELVVALVLVGLAVSEVAIRGQRAQAASACPVSTAGCGSRSARGCRPTASRPSSPPRPGASWDTCR